MITKLSEIIEKLPITMFFVCYLLYLGYEQYNFKYDADSAFSVKKKELEDSKTRREQMSKKLTSLADFAKNVEKKKSDLIQAVTELQGVRDAMPDRLDLPVLMKMLVTEAKKVGLTVQAISPVGEVKRDYYVEQPLKVKVSGAYLQILALFERLSSVNQIIQIDSFELTPDSEKSKKGPLLIAILEVKFFRYLGTKEDGGQVESNPSLAKEKRNSPLAQPVSAPSLPQGGAS